MPGTTSLIREDRGWEFMGDNNRVTEAILEAMKQEDLELEIEAEKKPGDWLGGEGSVKEPKRYPLVSSPQHPQQHSRHPP